MSPANHNKAIKREQLCSRFIALLARRLTAAGRG